MYNVITSMQVMQRSIDQLAEVTGTCFRPDFASKLVHGLAFGTPKFYIAPYGKINHGLVNLSCNCDVKSDLTATSENCYDRVHKRQNIGSIYQSGKNLPQISLIRGKLFPYRYLHPIPTC